MGRARIRFEAQRNRTLHNRDGLIGVDGPDAERLDNLFGTILLVGPLENGPAAYSTPPDNPFAAEGARGEIFAYDSAEEINFIDARDNDDGGAFAFAAPFQRSSVLGNVVPKTRCDSCPRFVGGVALPGRHRTRCG